MKQIIQLGIVSAIGLSVTLLATGCASVKPRTDASVCPQCRNVAVTPPPALHSPDQAAFYADDDTLRIEHHCPGCRTALTTFFTKGKWQHQCSICDQDGYTCPSSHL